MMRTPISRFALTILALAAAAFHAGCAEAVTRYSRNTSTWSTASNWTTNSNCNTSAGAAVPAAGDDAVICNGDTITLDTNTASLNSLTIRAGGTLLIGSNTTARTLTTASFSNAGTFTINTNANHQISITGAATNTGTFGVNAAVTTQTPDVTIGGLLTNTSPGVFQFAGGAALTWIVNGGISNSGTINVSTASNVTHTLQVQGAFSNTGTVNCAPDANSLCTLVFSGGTQTLGGGGTWTIPRLTLNNAGGLTLTQSITVSTLLTFTNGKITTGANVLTLASGATVSGASSARYVVGNLARGVPTGSPSLTWDIGTAGTYAPVTIAFTTVTVAGTVQASTTDGDHPSIAGSALDSTQSANRYWTLANAGTAYTSVSPTFAFVAGDVDAGATPTSFVVGKFALSDWSYPDIGTRTSTTTPATGILLADGLGDFAVAESNPAAFSEYRFEQSSYSGATGEVTDSGTGANNGTTAQLSGPSLTTSNASPAIAGDPGSCRYGVFNRATKQYVALPAGYPNLGVTSGFTVSAWIRTTDNTLSAQRVFIDDEQISSATGWGMSLGEAGTGALRFYTRGAASALTTDTTNVIASNTWYFVAVVADITLKRKHVYVFSTAGTVLANVTAVWTEASFGTDPGITSIGGETNASNGENTNGFGFSGNIDYVRVHQYPLGQEQLQQLRQSTHPCSQVDHYQITLPGGATAVTCDPAQVTVTAHDATHNPVTPPAGTVVSMSTSTVDGVWTVKDAGTGTFVSSGLNNGVASYAWPGGESAFIVRLRHNTTATLSVNLVDSDSKTEAAGEDPSLTYANAAFRISTGANTPLTIGTQISGKPSNTGFGSQNLFLQAIRTDTSTGACTGVFPNGSQIDIDVGAICSNPASCSQNVTLATSATTGTISGSFVPNGAFPSTIRFLFNTGNAEAPFRFSYADAGQIALQFRAALPSPPASTTMTGSSTAFVVRPFGLRISGVTTSASPAPTDAVLANAGANFNTTLTAVQWKSGDDADNNGVPDSEAQISGNAATPNFGQETAAATATLSSALNAPAGGAAGSLTGGSFSGFSSGTKTGAVSWSEVGFINLFAASSNYLGSGQSVTNSAAGLTGVGRFRPDRFVVTGRGTLAAGCATGTAFSYMGQSFAINNIQMEARNASNVVTTNYRGSYARFNPAVFANFGVGGRALDGSGTNLATRINAGSVASGSWGASSGVLTAAFSPIAVTRASPDAPDRFAQGRLGIAPTDPDGVAILASAYDLDVDNSGGSEHFQLVGAAAAGNVDLRFGRLRLTNAIGTQLLPLNVAARTEYWNGSSFVQNSDDGCTVIPRASIALAFTAGFGLTACETAVTASSITVTGGSATFTLAAPGGSNTGGLLLTPQLSTVTPGSTFCPAVGGTAITPTSAGLSWLLGNWDPAANPDGNANTAYDDNPSARVSFGIYGAQPSNFIFFRENY
jgi:MSHA biogenesis protein MshQ